MIGRALAWLRSRADRDAPQHIRDGRRGEEIAYQYLRGRGYTIVARGFRPRRGKGEIDLIGSPLKLNETPVDYRLAPPHCGQHTDLVLHELLHLNNDEIAALRAKNII